MSFWVDKLISWWVDKFPSFSKACEQRCYLYTIDRLLHYFSAFISMFQQRQLSNHATSPADSSNITCRIMQPHQPTCVTTTIESCNVTCRLEIWVDDLFPFWKNFTKRRRRRSHARFVVVLLILLILLTLLIYKERGLIINELRGVKLNGSSTVLSRLFNERFISNEKTTPWWPLICGKKRGQKRYLSLII